MKFVFFGYDFSVNVARRLIKDGHTLMGVFSFPCDNEYSFNTEIKALAEKQKTPYSQARPTPENIQHYIDQGTTLFLSCGYPYKIPPIDEARAYGLNTHPTYLPMGRGSMPTPTIITKHPESGGFTLHKITPDFDAGDILYQEKIKVTPRSTVDSYSNQIARRMPGALSPIIKDLPEFWSKATPQDETRASWFPRPTQATRTLKWSDHVIDLDKTLRAFGSYGSIALVNGRKYVIFAHRYKEEKHDFPPGTIVDANDRHIKIAARGGYLYWTEYKII